MLDMAAPPIAAPDPSQGSMPPAAPSMGPQPLVLTADQVSAWRRRVAASNEATKPVLDAGKVHIERYKGKYLEGTPSSDQVCVPTDFYYIEQKKAQLFYRLPEIFLKAQQPGKADAAVVFQAVINQKLGPQGVHILPRIKQVLFDVLCPTGYGAIKVGFEAITDGQGEVDGLGVPNIIAKRYFAEHVSPGDLVVPADFVGLDFDDAPYLAIRFREDLPDDASGGSDRADDRRLVPLPAAALSARAKQRTGYEVWYKAATFDRDVKHPDRIRCFKIYDDDEQAQVTVRDSPYQQIAQGKVTGMLGFPICPLTLRFVSDSWMVPSDAGMARNTADELSKGRTQMIQQRERSKSQWGFDSTRVDKDIQQKIERNELGAGIPFNGPGADATWPINKGQFGRENFTFNDYIQKDLDRIWGLGANQTSTLQEGGRTATELQIIQSASQTRLEQEREAVLGWYLNKIIPKFASLLQQFADEDEFVELIGADVQRLQQIPDEVKQQAQQSGQDARMLVPWNKDAIQGRFAFAAKANSQLFLDVAQYRKQLMDLYQFFANDPTVNRAELVREILQAYGFDPSKLIQQPPPKTAEPPKPALSFSGMDVSPASPQSPIVLDILSKLGIPVDPNVIATALAMFQQMPPSPDGPTAPNGAGPQMAHGGAAAQAEPLGKHQMGETGGMQGSGERAPVAPGGHLL